MIHGVVEVFIACNANADELFGGRVGDFIFVGVECSDEEIPFANECKWSEPSEVV